MKLLCHEGLELFPKFFPLVRQCQVSLPPVNLKIFSHICPLLSLSPPLVWICILYPSLHFIYCQLTWGASKKSGSGHCTNIQTAWWFLLQFYSNFISMRKTLPLRKIFLQFLMFHAAEILHPLMTHAAWLKTVITLAYNFNFQCIVWLHILCILLIWFVATSSAGRWFWPVWTRFTPSRITAHTFVVHFHSNSCSLNQSDQYTKETCKTQTKPNFTSPQPLQPKLT